MNLERNKGIGISGYELTKSESDLIMQNFNQIFCITLFSRNIENYDLIANHKAKEFLEIQKLKLQDGIKESKVRKNIDFFLKFDQEKDLIRQIDEKIESFDKKIKEIIKKENLTKEVSADITQIIINSKNSLKNLINSIKMIDSNIQIAIDHEGGIVNRFPWSRFQYKPASYFGELYQNDAINTKAKLRMQALEIANELKEFGIDIDFAAVLDLGINDFLKKRSFSEDPEIVFELGKIFIEELLSENIKICLKHLPGHGRAEDTHLEICEINEKKETLIENDLLPFKKICKAFLKEVKNAKIMGMISHVIYNDIDPENIASFSKKVIQFIKNNVSKDLILISDAIEMQGCLKFYKEYIEKQETKPNTKIQFSGFKEWLGTIRNEILESGTNIVLYCDLKDLSKTNFFEKKL